MLDILQLVMLAPLVVLVPLCIWPALFVGGFATAILRLAIRLRWISWPPPNQTLRLRSLLKEV